MNPISSDVLDRHLALDLQELAGRASPPDRVDAILRRLTATPSTARTSPARSRLLVAAFMLFGVGITIAVAMVRQSPAPGEATSVATAPVANEQEPRQTPPPAPQPAAPQPAAPQPVPQDPKPPQPKPPEPAPKQAEGKPPAAPAPNAKAHPKGTSPADLAAVRSAEKMLEQERKLMARLREGKLPGVDLVRFETLAGWKYTKGLEGMPDTTKALDGKKVAMIGFMLPIDEVKDIRHFLLVQSLWSCCYGTPPDIHGIVRIEMPKDRPIDYSFEPLLITGTLRVGATMEDGYCIDIYQLHADSVVVLQ